MCVGTWTCQPGDALIGGSLMILLKPPFSLLSHCPDRPSWASRILSCSAWLLPHFVLVGGRLDPLRRPHLHCAKPPHPRFPTSITFLASLTSIGFAGSLFFFWWPASLVQHDSFWLKHPAHTLRGCPCFVRGRHVWP